MKQHKLPDWSSEKKLLARYETIISQYQNIFGTSTIPENKEYWTMCGKCGDNTGKLINGCELDQIINYKLISTPKQFHGVEIDGSVYRINSGTKIDANWYNNDFYNQLSRTQINPAIVNVDTVRMPEKGAAYFSKIMFLLGYKNVTNAMVIWNSIIKIRSHQSSVEDMIKEIEENEHFQSAYRKGWKMVEASYTYTGSANHNNTEMASLIFYKKE